VVGRIDLSRISLQDMAFPRGINPGVLNFVCVSEVAPSTFKASANFFFLFSSHQITFTTTFFFYGQFLFLFS
jgi:hypothetical protein